MKIALLSLGTILFAATLSNAAPLAPLTFLKGSTFVKLERIIYTYGTPSSSYNLRLCINDTLLDEDSTAVITDKGTQTNIPGTQDATKPDCFDFTDVSLPSDNEDVRYDLHLHKGQTRRGPIGVVKYNFRQLDQVTNFVCDGVPYSRVVYPGNGTVDSHVDQTCIPNTNVCYLNGGSSATGGNGSLCLPGFDAVTQKGMVYCQPGTTANKTTDALYQSSLHYDGHYDFAYDMTNSTYKSEAILSVAGNVKISKTDGNSVPIAAFTPGTDKYTVCAVQLDESENIKIVATSAIQDLDVHGEDSWGDCQLNLANLNTPTKAYQFSSTSAPSPTNIDCTRVDGCYGFVTCASTDEMKVTYGTGENVLVVPYTDLTPEPVGPPVTKSPSGSTHYPVRREPVNPKFHKVL